MTIHDFTSRELTLKVNLTLRVATLDDIKKLEWDGQFTHYRNIFRRAYIEQHHGKRLLLVMVFNRYPIARLFIQFIGENNTIANGKDRGYIYSFTVMEPFRNLGIGTRMLASAENILRKRGYQIASISVAKENLRAIKLYKRQGYCIYGQDDGQWQYRDHHGNVRQVDEPNWLMKKPL